MVREQRHVVRSVSSAEFNGLGDTIEPLLLSLLLLQVVLHQIYRGISESPHQLADNLEVGKLHFLLDLSVDAKAVSDAVKAIDVCDPAEFSSKFHYQRAR